MHSKTGINISIIPAAFITYAIVVLCPFSSAYADYTDVESYSYDFLVETANAADVTPNEFVVNYVFSSNVVTGQNLTDETGMSLSDDVETNLSHMRETEDYPNWENLPDTWKQRWGTPKDYYASKFNHLYAAGSGGRGYETDMSQFEGSGGDDFSWTDTVYDGISSIGRAFKKFLLGDANSVGELLTNFQPDAKTSIENYMALPNYTLVDGSEYSNWPSGLPSRIPVSYTDYAYAYSGTSERGTYTNVPTYRVAILRTEEPTKIVIYTFSENTFKFLNEYNANLGTPRANATNRTYNDGQTSHTFYMTDVGTSNLLESNIPYVTVTGFSVTTANVNNMLGIILFGGQNLTAATSNPIIDYPETINTSVNVYLPDNVNDSTTWIDYVTPSENNPGTGTDLTAVITILRRIETALNGLDSTSEDLTDLETALAQFHFYANGILKVHDEGVFDSLTDIGSDIHDILLTLTAWPKGDAPDAPDIIGDFDFDELQDKSDLLLESISDLAPFGALLLLSEMVGVLSQTGNLEDPEMVIPFDFMPGQSYDVNIDLSWLDAGKVYINFFCILSLILCLLNITIRIVELEAAS